MPQYPFPPAGPGAEEPPGSAPLPGSGSGNGPADSSGHGGPSSGAPSSGGPSSGAPSSGGPDGGWAEVPPGGPEQGLFICLPAENMELSRFAGEDGHPAMPPGPLLAGVAAAVVGGDGSGLAGVSEDFLVAVIIGGRRMASWGTWLEFSAMRELALGHPAVPRRFRRDRPAAPIPNSPDQPGTQKPAGSTKAAAAGSAGSDGTARPDGSAAIPADDGRVPFSEFVPDELAPELQMTWLAAADRVAYACGLATRLPVTFAAMGGGLIDPLRAKIIYEQTDILSAADAAKADPILAEAAQFKTYGEVRAAATRLTLKLDPESAERRKQARRKEAHVRAFREESGNAGISAREMPSDEVLASMQHVDQRARDLRAAGIPGTLQDLRVRAYLDLLQGRDIRDTLHDPDPNPDHHHEPDEDGGSDGPDGPGGPGGNPAPGTSPARRGTRPAGPSLAALVNLTVPLGTVLGESATPGEAAGFGLLDAQSARDLIAAAGRDPRTRWCVTALHPDGTAAAHACATGQHPPPPGPEPPGPEPPGPEPPGPEPPGPEPPGPEPPGPEPPGTTPRAQEYLRGLKVRLTMIARGTCDHRHAETGYQPSRKLQHLIRTRSTHCTAPGCGRPASLCDLDHTIAWHLGGRTCECGLAPSCKS